MHQLELKTGTEIDVDGMVDAKGVRFLGKAILMGDGTWRCLADVDGALCRVEVKITFECSKDKEAAAVKKFVEEVRATALSPAGIELQTKVMRAMGWGEGEIQSAINMMALQANLDKRKP